MYVIRQFCTLKKHKHCMDTCENFYKQCIRTYFTAVKIINNLGTDFQSNFPFQSHFSIFYTSSLAYLYRISHTYTFVYLCMSGDSSIHCKSIVLDSYYDEFRIQYVKTYFAAVKYNNNEINKVTCLF